MKRSELVAPCGIHCAICPLYLAGENHLLLEALVEKGVSREKLPCKGCRALEGRCPVLETPCETYACIASRGHDFCYQCQEYPCKKLNPASHRAEVLPHNTKVFNLGVIEHQWMEAFLKRSQEVQARYYKGKMAVGRGPVLEGEEKE